jgi:hypothetical protein
LVVIVDFASGVGAAEALSVAEKAPKTVRRHNAGNSAKDRLQKMVFVGFMFMITSLVVLG